jgi:hypothetical protein
MPRHPQTNNVSDGYRHRTGDNMASVVNLASDETLVKEAYARVKGDWAALESDSSCKSTWICSWLCRPF